MCLQCSFNFKEFKICLVDPEGKPKKQLLAKRRNAFQTIATNLEVAPSPRAMSKTCQIICHRPLTKNLDLDHDFFLVAVFPLKPFDGTTTLVNKAGKQRRFLGHLVFSLDRNHALQWFFLGNPNIFFEWTHLYTDNHRQTARIQNGDHLFHEAFGIW